MVSPQTTSNPGVVSRGFLTEEEARSHEISGVRERGHLGWPGVIGGAILSISLLILSASFAYACGVPAFSGGTYGWGAGIWSVVTAIIAFYAGGCVAAYASSHLERPRLPMLHGVMAWALALPLILLLFGGVSSLFGHSAMGNDISRMTINGFVSEPTLRSSTGPAWGAFLSLVLGLIFAAIGGATASNWVRSEAR